MGRRRAIFPIALGCSLLLHVSAAAVYTALAPLWRPAEPAASQELVLRLDDLGERNADGIGSNASRGRTPLEAPEADADQALLSRDRTGEAHPLASSASAMNIAAPAPEIELPSRKAMPQPASPDRLIDPTPPAATGLTLPVQEPRPAANPTPLNMPTPPPAVAVADARPPSSHSASTPVGDPLPQSESDSDPFSRISGTVVVHDGFLEPRFGRKVKTVRPHLGINELETITLSNPVVVLEVHIDPTGRVSDVRIAHGSGSVAIDEPTRNAVYQWWFEPAHDRAGRPIADVIYFTIEYRD